MNDKERADFKNELEALLRREESPGSPYDHLLEQVVGLLEKGDRAWDKDPDSPASKLITASFAAPDEVDEELIPPQGPALTSLLYAIRKLHPAVVEALFNDVDPEGRFDPDGLLTQDRLLIRIANALTKSGSGHHRPPKNREREIVRRIAQAFQRYCAHTSDEPGDYLRDVMLFVAFMCSPKNLNIPIPVSRDRLLAYIPPTLRVPR